MQVARTLSHLPVRSVNMVRLLDTVLVAAVATLLLVRWQLWLGIGSSGSPSRARP